MCQLDLLQRAVLRIDWDTLDCFELKSNAGKASTSSSGNNNGTAKSSTGGKASGKGKDSKNLASKKNTVQPNPTPTRAQFNAVNGLQLTSATAIQIKFEYPYKAQHSIRSAVELPNQRRAPHSAIGTTPVYP